MGADFSSCTFVIGMKPRVILPVPALLVVGLLSAGLHAQSVGIGTASPDPSARLHIEDNARGLLIPNVELTATNVAAPVTNPATSLLVYNTATAGSGATAVTPGFYYWNGSQWVRLADGGNAWLLTGNAGTNPAANFLGTTDAQPLCIRVDNQETFRFNPPGAGAPAWSIQRGGGDPRGLHAVDLQSERSAATQVASGDYSVIGGGQDNTASGWWATVGGGWSNTASGGGATVGGGAYNTASGLAATVGGGAYNTASEQAATVGGGEENTASGFAATVGGGASNNASFFAATVGGGDRNTASGVGATVGGGHRNTASRDLATVGGGYQNTASGDYSAIPGGYNLRVGRRSFGFSGQTSATETDLSANPNIAAFVDVDLWLYSRDFTNASQLRFYEAQAYGSGANYVALRAPTSLSANTTYTLPASLTTTNTVATGILQTDASGNLSWLDPSALGGGGAGWALTGNSITSAWNGTSGNFLGTTNAQPLVIATTNTTTPQPIQIWVGNQETFRFNPPGAGAPAWSIQRGGGNTRGFHAVDLQSERSAAT